MEEKKQKKQKELNEIQRKVLKKYSKYIKKQEELLKFYTEEIIELEKITEQLVKYLNKTILNKNLYLIKKIFEKTKPFKEGIFLNIPVILDDNGNYTVCYLRAFKNNLSRNLAYKKFGLHVKFPLAQGIFKDPEFIGHSIKETPYKIIDYKVPKNFFII